MGLPKINITFSSTASTAVLRSARGIVCLLLSDTTAEEPITEYTSPLQVETAKWSKDSIRYIKETLMSGCSKVYAVRTSAQFDAETQAHVDSIKWNWICSPVTGVQTPLVTYIKAKNASTPGRKVKALVYNATAPNDDHVVNFTNVTVTRIGGKAESGLTYTPRLAGVLAALPFTRSATYYNLEDLEAVSEPKDADGDIDAGKFVLINDFGEPKIGADVTSLTDEVSGKSKSICIVEAMDLILEDIYETFKRVYVGKFKNKYSNQALFVTAVNNYFKNLQKEDVLDPEFNNEAYIDIEAQRSAWIDAGKAEAVDWDELKIKKMSYRSKMFLAGNIKILDAIEDLDFSIALA